MADPLHKRGTSTNVALVTLRPALHVRTALATALALAILVFLTPPVFGSEDGSDGSVLAMQPGSAVPISDTNRPTPQTPSEPDTLALDTLETASDTVTVPPREFVSPFAPGDSDTQALSRLWESPVWPLPPPVGFAAGDLSDWLTYQPTYDVADAPGPGQFRRYTHWGLIDRVGEWRADGRSFGWQRLSFPQTAQFDPTVLPSFEYREVEAGERVSLRRSDEWPLQARSSYFLRQGDYGETYSQGNFRRRFPSAFALDLDFLFYSHKGRSSGANVRNRNLRLQLVGPLKQTTFWTVVFTQFMDESRILMPEQYQLLPQRDDLLYSLDASIYRPPDSGFFRAAGLRLQSGKHDIRASTTYKLESHDQTWTLWGEGTVRGWHLTGSGIVEHLRLDSVDQSRGGLEVGARKLWPVGGWGSGSIHATISGWDTDPFALSIAGVVAADRGDHRLIPSVKIERTRFVPTLFDRQRPLALVELGNAGSSGLSLYMEEGNPSVSAEWRNSAMMSLQTRSDSAHSDFEFITEAQATYVQRYLRWEDVSTTGTTASYRPVSGDVRTVGIAAALRSHLFSKFYLWLNYAAKYAETLNHERLTGYYPQKGSAILSWIAPQFHYKIDLRLNAAFIWWYGDARIVPTGYDHANTFRVDLSGSATMKSFTFYYSMQNIADFRYRTTAGYPLTGRSVRFGFNWDFLN